MSEMQITTFDQAEQRLAFALPGYESRPQQQKLAHAVEQALADGTHLIAEAGCGTGKSFATLIPAILAGKRVLVSTATKALQDQIASKDLPFLAEHLGVPFTYALLKGRSNYLCQAQVVSDEAGTVVDLPKVIARTEEEDFTGEREDLGFAVSDREWYALTTSAEDCPGAKRCPFGGSCYAERAKAAARAANVVVVNHALLLTELKVRLASYGNATMLGEYDAVIVDEAHELEEYAMGAFGARVTEAGIRKLVTEIRNWVREFNLDESIVDAGDAVLAATVQLWSVLEEGRIRPATILEHEEEWVAMALSLQTLAKEVANADLGYAADHQRASTRREQLHQRADRLAVTITDMAIAEGGELVRWVELERNRRGDDFVSLKSAPVDVSPFLREALFESTPTVLVSATIAVDGSFDYVANRLGVDEYEGLDVGTPFDFEAQARLYIPRDLPEPSGATRGAWEALATERIRELVMASKGRALLLFTSVKQMKAVYEVIADRLPYTCLMQGQGQLSNKELAARFKEETDSVLFATRSFFTGVDFGGETLSLVVIDKLPFPVPTEPITEARCEAVEARGGNAFRDYTIPVMSLVLAQGFGRLIRTKTDTGVVAILDPRLLTKGYGGKIRRSLPPAPLVERLDQVEEFFAELEAMASLESEEVEA